MSRLTIDITDQQHQALKAMAALQGKSIKDYAVELLFPQDRSEEDALNELRTLLEQRLAEAKAKGVCKQTITAVAEEVLSSGGMA